MKDKNDGGPAFPSPALDNCALPGCEGGPMRGMSLRDWFAGVALQGMLSAGNSGSGNVTVGGQNLSYDQAAFVMADAMLAERSK